MSDLAIGALVVYTLALILNLLDIHSTKLFLSVGIPEGNKIFGPTFNKHPMWKAIVAKLGLSLFLLWVTYYYRNHETYLYILICVGLLLVVYYTYIVATNYQAYLREKE